MIQRSARCTIRNGESINIKEDWWLASGELVTEFNNPRVQKVSRLLARDKQGWDHNIIRNTFDSFTTIKVIQTLAGWAEGEDTLWWPPCSSGEYSVKTGYHEICRQEARRNERPSGSSGVEKEVWKVIWSATIPQKINFFLWKACNDILSV